MQLLDFKQVKQIPCKSLSKNLNSKQVLLKEHKIEFQHKEFPSNEHKERYKIGKKKIMFYKQLMA